MKRRSALARLVLALWLGACARDPSAPKFVRIESGGANNCAIREDGSAVCWGVAFPEGPLELEGPVEDVGVGFGQACILRNGRIECLGPDDPENETLEEPEGEYRGVSSGLSTACGILTDGSVRCWGGNEPTTTFTLPEPAAKLRQVVNRVCAVTLAKTAYCLLTPDNVRRLPGGSYLEAVPHDVFARCGLTTAGAVVCEAGACYADSPPELPCGDPSDWQGKVGPGPGGPFTHLAVSSSFFMCGLRPNGDFTCWGSDYDVDLWEDPSLRSLEPAGTRFRDLSAGSAHICGITLDGEIACWGDNRAGQASPPAARDDADGGARLNEAG